MLGASVCLTKGVMEFLYEYLGDFADKRNSESTTDKQYTRTNYASVSLGALFGFPWFFGDITEFAFRWLHHLCECP
jgi:hypothetical protein